MGARRGRARVSRRSPPPPPSKIKKSFLAILGDFLLLFLHMGFFLLRFSHFWGPFHHGGAFLLLFTSRWGPMIAKRVREHAPRKCFCVTEFWTCFVTILSKKMTKIMINCSHVPARWV